jgi:membrane protease YdiL (CAAX protease family)
MQSVLVSYIRGLSRAAEVVVVVAIFAGWFIYASLQAVLAGFPAPEFDDGSLLFLVWFEVAAFVCAWSFLHLRGWRLAHLDLRMTLGGLLVGALLYGVSLLIDGVIWDLFAKHSAAREMLENIVRDKSVGMLTAVAVSTVNGTFEEFFLTGYLLKALRPAGASVALGVSALVRVSYHLYQGPLGALTVLAFGIVVTAFYWRYRALWPVISAHILADLAALSS